MTFNNGVINNLANTMTTIFHGFQFSEPSWLWGLILVPIMWALYLVLYGHRLRGAAELKDFADPHLLPHLLDNGYDAAYKRKRNMWLYSLSMWTALWSLGLLSMAGPRWDYTDVKAYEPARNVVVLLDMSRSMDVQDIKPSRLARARQEI